MLTARSMQNEWTERLALAGDAETPQAPLILRSTGPVGYAIGWWDFEGLCAGLARISSNRWDRLLVTHLPIVR